MGVGLRDLESEGCADPPICLRDDEIGARGGGEDADEDVQEERGGAAERRRCSRHVPRCQIASGRSGFAAEM